MCTTKLIKNDVQQFDRKPINIINFQDECKNKLYIKNAKKAFAFIRGRSNC